MKKIILICLIIIVLVRCLFGIYVKEKYIYIPNEEKVYIETRSYNPTKIDVYSPPLSKSDIFKNKLEKTIKWLTVEPFHIPSFARINKTKPTSLSAFVIYTNGDLYMLEDYPRNKEIEIKKYLKTLSTQELEEIKRKIEKNEIDKDHSIWNTIKIKGKEYYGISGYELLEKYISFE